MGRRIVVATQLPQDIAGPYLGDLEDVDLRTVGPDLSRLDPDVECLIPLPATHIGPITPPAIWPGPVRWVQLLSAGIDGYPDWLLDGVLVTGMQGVNAAAVAELAMASVLAAAKRLPQLWEESASWQQHPVEDLAGATIGIVGFGAIGEAVAQRAAAFGMDIQALRASDQPMPPEVRRAASIEELFASSDHVVRALPASAKTRKLVNADLLGHAKKGLHLVNVARGDCIDESALLAAIESGIVSLASLDVLTVEPPSLDHPFLRHPRIRVSPHSGGNTAGARSAMADRLLRNMRAYREGRELEGLVARPGRR